MADCKKKNPTSSLAFIADKARHYFEQEARQRQAQAGAGNIARFNQESGYNVEGELVPVPGPELVRGDARDQAGQALGISGNITSFCARKQVLTYYTLGVWITGDRQTGL